jgi:tetratricopeptide (TPR) repeat protein
MASARRLGVLAAAALLAAALGSGCGDPAKREQQHLSRAEAYLEEGKTAEAVLELRNALQLVPNDARAHHALARAYLAANQSDKALWELQETIRLDAGNLDARLQYGRLLLLGGKPELEEAVKQADDVLAADPSRVAALLLKGRALQQLGHPDEALRPLEQAVQAAPQDTSVLLVLANVYMIQGDKVQAEALFRKLVEVSPSYSSYATLAGFLAVLGRDAEAEQAYRTAIERAEGKDRPKAHITLSNFLVSRGRGADAERVLEQGIEALDDDLDLVYTLARQYQLRGAAAEADGIIQRAAEERPSDPMPLVILSRYRAERGDFDGALEASDRALGVAPDDIQTRLQKAELLVDVGVRGGNKERILEGRRMVEAVIEADENVPAALFVRGKVELAEGNREAAAKTLRGVIDLQPDWALPHYVLGATLFANGDPQGARTALDRALELDPTHAEARKLLARVHTALGDSDLAIELARRSLSTADDPSLHFLIAQNLIRQRKFDDAAKELAAIPEAQRGAEDWYALGRVAIFQKDDAAARKYLLRAQQKDPGRFEVLQALLALDAKERRLAESKERIQAAASARPSDSRLVRLLGQLSFLDRDLPAAEASFKRAIEIAPNDASVYETLAAFLAATGRPDEVVPTLEAALARSPNTASLHFALGSMYFAKARTKDAQARYEDAIRLDPKLALAKNDLAYLLAASGENLDRAFDLAREAKALLPESPLVADTLGYVLLKRNVADAALGYFQEAVAGMDPDDPLLPTVRHHLALAYQATGDVPSARDQVERALVELEGKNGSAAAAAASTRDPAPELRALRDRLQSGGG